jgi:hypothetical protein
MNLNSNSAVGSDSLPLAVAPMMASSSINLNALWIDNGTLLHYTDFYSNGGWGTFSNHSSYGLWHDGLDHFVGLRILSNNHYYYGWVRLQILWGECIVKDYAYNILPDQPILAGAPLITSVQNPITENQSVQITQEKNWLKVFLNDQSFVNGKLNLINTLGQPLINQTINDQNMQINLENFSAGVYFLSLENQNKRFVKEIFIQ